MGEVSGMAAWLPDDATDVRAGLYVTPSLSSEFIKADAAHAQLTMSMGDLRAENDLQFRLAQQRLSRSLFSIDRNDSPTLWLTPPSIPQPWHRRALTWFDDAWERCLGAVGLCRVSRRHEHDEDD